MGKLSGNNRGRHLPFSDGLLGGMLHEEQALVHLLQDRLIQVQVGVRHYIVGIAFHLLLLRLLFLGLHLRLFDFHDERRALQPNDVEEPLSARPTAHVGVLAAGERRRSYEDDGEIPVSPQVACAWTSNKKRRTSMKIIYAPRFDEADQGLPGQMGKYRLQRVADHFEHVRVGEHQMAHRFRVEAKGLKERKVKNRK